MVKPTLRFSKMGAWAAAVFLGLAGAVFAWVFLVASKNPADSGESGILLLPFAMPWIMLMPDWWVGPFAGLAAILFNGAIVYLVFGGLRRRKASEP